MLTGVRAHGRIDRLVVGVALALLLTGAFTTERAAGAVSGANRFELWVEDSLGATEYLNQLDVHYQSENWLVGARLEFDEETTWDPERETDLIRRYAEYSDEYFSVRGGNFYTTFGRGLLLRAMEEDEVRLDRDIDGLSGSVNWNRISGQGFVGRPRNDDTLERDDLLSGAEVDLQIADPLSVGGGYVRLDASGDAETEFRGHRPIEELAGGHLQFIHGALDLYFEGAKRMRRGERDPRGGWTGTQAEDGEALYGSVTLGIPGYVLLLEGKDYDRFDFDYSTPPPANREGTPINNGRDERGIGAVLTASPRADFTIDGNGSFAEASAADDDAERGAFGLTVRKDWWGRGSVQLGWDWVAEKRLEGHDERDYYGLTYAAGYYLTEQMSITTKGHVYARSDSLQGARDEYTELSADLTLSHASGKSLTLSVISASEPVREFDGDDLWFLAQLSMTFGYSHEVVLKLGEERGGITCAGGVCHYEPPFKGVRVEFVSRL